MYFIYVCDYVCLACPVCVIVTWLWYFMQGSQWWKTCWLVKTCTTVLNVLFWVILHRPCPIWPVSLPSSSIQTAAVTHVIKLNESYFLPSRNGQEQNRSSFILHQFFQLITTPSNQLHIYETGMLRRVSSVTNVSSVTSTGDCLVQVLPSSLTGSNIDLFTKTMPLTLHY